MSDRTTTFAELISEELIEIGAGRPRTVSLNGHDLPILRVADVLDGRIESAFHAHASNQELKSGGPKVSRPGDIVLTTKGTVGRVALMPVHGPVFAYSPQLCYFRPAPNGQLRSRFLYYWFKSAEFWIQANALKGQTDMADFLSLGDVQSMRIGLPSRDRQDAIVDVLGALDDKIAANQRIISTAAALVDEMLERFLRHQDSAVETTLGSVCAVNAIRSDPVNGSELRYIDIASVSRGRVTWPAPMNWDQAPGRARRGVRKGDVIWSTVRPNRRSHALILDDDPILVASTGFAVLSPVQIGSAYLYGITTRAPFVEYLESVAEGSAYPAVRAERFAEAKIPLPARDVLPKFEKPASALFSRAHAAEVENRTLVSLRDVLLPKLISGELRIKDAEQLVSNAV
jgi:type I restriction enzyme S subunit